MLRRLAAVLEADRWVFLLATALHLLVVPIRRPLILPDEAGFLLTAMQIGTDGAPSGLGYYPGYSLLLAPFTGLTVDLEPLMIVVQAVNAVLAGCTAVLAARLARALIGPDAGAGAGAIGLAVSAYPSFRVFGAFALAENLMIPVTLLLCLLLLRATETRTPLSVTLFAVVAGLSYALHARAVAIPLAAAVAIVVVFRDRRQLQLIGFGALAISSAAAFLFVEATLANSGIVTVDSDSRDTLSGLIRSSVGLRPLYDIALTGVGQLFYIVAATAGLAIVGWTHLGAKARAAGPSRARDLAWLIVPLTVVTFGISAMFLNDQSGDQAIYGRYNEGVLAPTLVIALGLLWTRADTFDRAMRLAVVTLPVAAAVLILGRGPDVFDGRQQTLNIAGVFPVVDVVGAIRLSAIVAAGVVAIVFVAFAARRSPVLAVAGLVGLFVVTAAWDIQHMADAVEVLDHQDELVADIEAIVDISGSDCVAIDRADGGERWHQENYRLRLAPLRFEHFDSSNDPSGACSDLVVSPRTDLDESIPGAAVVAVEPSGRQLLWVLPGETARRVADSGRPLYPDPDRPLPVTQQLEVILTVRDNEVEPGGEVTGTVELVNHGPAPLFPERAFPTSEFAVNVGLEWRDPERGQRRYEPERLRLPRIVAPGERVELVFVTRALDPSGQLALGEHRLRAEVVQEAVAWTGYSDSVIVSVVREPRTNL